MILYNDIEFKNSKLFILQPAHKVKTYKLIFEIQAIEARKEIQDVLLRGSRYREKVKIVGLFDEKLEESRSSTKQ